MILFDNIKKNPTLVQLVLMKITSKKLYTYVYRLYQKYNVLQMRIIFSHVIYYLIVTNIFMLGKTSLK